MIQFLLVADIFFLFKVIKITWLWQGIEEQQCGQMDQENMGILTICSPDLQQHTPTIVSSVSVLNKNLI